MSSSRSVAAARARRAGGSNSSAGRPSQPGFSKHPPAMTPPQNDKVEEKAPAPKGLSVSDAFALVTIRLGRVEMALQKLDIHNIAQKVADGESSESIASNVIVKSIASRIDDLEKSIQEKTGESISSEQLDIINGVQVKVVDLDKEVRELKDQIYKLQSFALDVNQKLAELKEKLSAQESKSDSEEEDKSSIEEVQLEVEDAGDDDEEDDDEA